MKLVNLLPKTQQRELELDRLARAQLLFWIWIAISLVIFLILTLIARVYLSRQAAVAADQISNQRLVLKSSDNEELRQQVENVNLQINGINNLQSQHIYWSKALTELSNLFASDIRLDLLTIDRATGRIDVKGTAGSRDSVLAFWSDIHKSPYFRDINFPLANLERSTDDSFNFTFYANTDKLKQP